LENSSFFVKAVKKYSFTCEEYYAPLWRRGISADIVSPHDDLTPYDLVIAPMLYMTDETTIQNLTAYVEQGGTLYATYLLGMANENDLCYLGGFPAKGLKEVFGIWNEELDTLYPEETVCVRMTDGTEYRAVDGCEIIHAKGAQVLATYESEFYAGSPALTVHSYGTGKAYYQACRDTGELWERVCGDILAELNVLPTLPEAPPHNVTAHLREDGDDQYLFVQNYSDAPIQGLPLRGEWKDMESGEKLCAVDLDAFDIRILKKLS